MKKPIKRRPGAKRATPEQLAALKFKALRIDAKPMTNQEAIDTALQDIFNVRFGVIILGHDHAGLEQLVRGAEDVEPFVKLVDVFADMKERAKLQIKFCEAVEVRLLCAMARVAA